MADAPAFLPQGQSPYAFPADQGVPDEVDQQTQQHQQIQAAFDTQRQQRAFVQAVAQSAAKSGANTERQRIAHEQALRQDVRG